MFQAHLPNSILELGPTKPWPGHVLWAKRFGITDRTSIRLGPLMGRLGPWHPDANLDEFYVAAMRGEDYPTGEIVDRVRFDAFFRDAVAYRDTTYCPGCDDDPSVASLATNHTCDF